MTYLGAATITIVAARPATGTVGVRYRTPFDGEDAFGNILETGPGCVKATVTVRAPTGGGTETTGCKR
jgi:hypothetical protein